MVAILSHKSIVKLPFDISQSVKKGDLLCQLDPTDEQLAVRSADAAVAQSAVKVAQGKFDLEQAEQNLVTTRHKDESMLASAKVKAANLRAKAERQKQLVEQKLGAPEDLETAQTEAAAADAAMESAEIAIEELKQQQIQVEYKRESIKTAAAQLQADQVTLEIQKQQLAYTTVTAPIDGVVSALNVQRGAIVASGMSGFSGGTTILTLSDLSHVFVTATVDESDIGQVQVGQRTGAHLIGVRAVKGPLSDAFDAPENVPTLDQWQQQAPTARQDLIAAGRAVESARLSLQAAIREYFPSVTINFSYFLYNDPASEQFNEKSNYLSVLRSVGRLSSVMDSAN